MPNLIEQFGSEYFVLNSISKQRRSQVTLELQRLEAFLGGAIEAASADDLRAWLVSQLNDGLEPSTVALHLTTVMPFYRWCWHRRIISADDLLRLREVKRPRGYASKGPRPYSGRELAQMWAELDARFPYATPLRLTRWRNGTSPFRSVRKHTMRLQLNAIIELALVCGLRRGEIYNLSIDDVHWDNKYVVVHGKRVDQNDKVRDVPYPDSVREAIKAWFRMRGSIGPEPGVCLWLSVTGPDPAKPLRYDRMASILHSFGDWTLHRLRHTCATERLRAGMDLEKLQRFLGHATIAQTLQYASLARGDIHRASERIDADFQRAIRPAA